MTTGPNVPEDIMDAIALIRDMREKTYVSRLERENLNKAKLRVAYWVCRNENIVASRENLAYILGSDATDIMNAYDKYLEKEKEKEQSAPEKPAKPKPGDTKKRGAGGQFWEGV